MFGQVILALGVILVGFVYKALKPPRPKVCGTPGGPPVTSPRIKLSDGRHLAYREFGVSKDEAKYKIIWICGHNGSMDDHIPVSREFVEDLKLYFLLYDRPGYGESTPYPKRSVKSDAYDIQELADALQLGPKFYVIGGSLGGYPVWSCLRYIPQRLAGASLVNPFVHYWWPRFPSNLSRRAMQKLPAVADQWTFRVAHYAPWLFYWWMTQKWFPTLSFMSMDAKSKQDIEIEKKLSHIPRVGQDKKSQQGIYESVLRDILVGYADWGFSPLDLKNPFPNDEGSVHLWQGYEDRIIPVEINRFIAEKLPWIKYHEIADGGHGYMAEEIMCETIIKALVLG